MALGNMTTLSQAFARISVSRHVVAFVLIVGLIVGYALSRELGFILGAVCFFCIWLNAVRLAPAWVLAIVFGALLLVLLYFRLGWP